MDSKYTYVGSAWKDNGRISVRLNNGMRLSLFDNKYKDPANDNSPHYKVSAPNEIAKELGIEPAANSEEKPKDLKEEVNVDDIPF